MKRIICVILLTLSLLSCQKQESKQPETRPVYIQIVVGEESEIITVK